MKISIGINLDLTEAEGLRLIEEEYKPHSIKQPHNSNNNIRNMIAKEVDRQLRNQMNPSKNR